MKPEPKDRNKKERREHVENIESVEASRREIDPEFQRLAQEILERYRPAMKELAK